MADFVTALLGKLDAPPTPENMRFLNAWVRAEGTKAGNNPLATTQPAPGATPFNSANVRNYPDFNTGLDATTQTLLNGRYGPIVSGLRSGASATELGQAVAASPWGTGSGVLRVLGSPGGSAVPPSAPAPLPPASLPAVPTTRQVPAEPDFTSALLGSLGKDPGAQLQAITGAISAALAAPPTTIQMPGTELHPSLNVPRGSAPPSADFKPGIPVPENALASIGAEHPTAGLDGYPAHDYMAKAGTPVIAPVGGTIIRLSGHDPNAGPTDGIHGPFGLSLYLRGTDGRTYYMTHLGSRDVREGSKVKPGSVLGTVGDYARWGGADHVHMGVS